MQTPLLYDISETRLLISDIEKALNDKIVESGKPLIGIINTAEADITNSQTSAAINNMAMLALLKHYQLILMEIKDNDVLSPRVAIVYRETPDKNKMIKWLRSDRARTVRSTFMRVIAISPRSRHRVRQNAANTLKEIADICYTHADKNNEIVQRTRNIVHGIIDDCIDEIDYDANDQLIEGTDYEVLLSAPKEPTAG